MKKLLFAIIAVIVVISMFAGCGKQSVAQDDPTLISNDVFKITVPEDWPEKIHISFTDKSINMYHKASQEAGCGGWLVSISEYEDEVYKEMPSYEVVLMDNEKFYVAEYPSDVQADVENEEIMKEYFEMFEQLPGIIKETFELL